MSRALDDEAGAPLPPLFVTDDDLHRRLNPRMGRDRFRAVLKVAEVDGFPPVHKLWGGRYWPKVKAWLDRHNRVDEHETTATAEDGQENFNASPKRIARPQAKPARPAILDGAPDCEERPRISRSLHSITGGR